MASEVQRLRCRGLAACLGLLALGVEATMKGINYGVAPTASGMSPNDDFMCDDAAPLWGQGGRGDLEVIRALGANTVRLYGNDPRTSHRGFLDAAQQLGLEVIPGNSDWPYTQSPRNCMEHSDFDCSAQVKASFAQNLRNGFLLKDGSYHPALTYVVAINEPEMKLPDIAHPQQFCKAVISALDGMLEAEKEAKVNAQRPLPKFTVTFSFALCPSCGKLGGKPSLGQMWQLRDAMLNPVKYGYEPRNDLAALYETRFVNSFNTHNPSSDMRPLILDAYEVEFPGTPLFIGEYHSPAAAAQQEDIENMMSLVESSPVLLGISYFEYLKRQDLDHAEFGLFDLGEDVVADMRYFGTDYGVTCVRPATDSTGSSLPAQVARAFKGSHESDAVFHPFRCITGAVATSSTTTSTTTTTTSVTSTTTSSTTATNTTTTTTSTTATRTNTTTTRTASTSTVSGTSTTTSTLRGSTTAGARTSPGGGAAGETTQRPGGSSTTASAGARAAATGAALALGVALGLALQG